MRLKTCHRLFIGLLSGAILGCSPTPTLKVCANPTEPFFFDEEGARRGVEIELLEGFARRSGRQLDLLIERDFDRLLPRLEAGDCDLVSGTLTRTTERAQRIDFSEGYFPVRVVLVEPKSGGRGGLDRLDSARVATIRGTLYADLFAQVPGVELVYADEELGLFELVSSGQAEALACDSSFVLHLLRDFPDLAITEALTERQEYAFGLHQGSELKRPLDAYLAEMKAGGEYARILETYFGPEVAEDIAGPRAVASE